MSTQQPFFTTPLGSIYHGDSLALLSEQLEPASVDLIVTSPPFALLRKKAYGNVSANEYLDWFRPFGDLFKRLLRPNGSLVIDIGGAWNSRQPTRSLYHYKLLIMLCEEVGFHLAQEFFWWNPAKLPTPAEWVTIRRVRVKDAVDCLWWLSPTPWPKASNRRVLTPYSDAMNTLLRDGYTAAKHPSGHVISKKFSRNNGAAIPPNLLPFPNTESMSRYLRYCREQGLPPHPARYPAEVPEYFIRMLTDPGDLVVDPFAGSCVTGEVAERLQRRWVCVDLVEEYLRGAVGRFQQEPAPKTPPAAYAVNNPAHSWDALAATPLVADGGQKRPGNE